MAEQKRHWMDPEVFPPITDGLPTWDSTVPDWVYADAPVVDSAPPWEPETEIDWYRLAQWIGVLMVVCSLLVVGLAFVWTMRQLGWSH
jgi:hypothetical protein